MVINSRTKNKQDQAILWFIPYLWFPFLVYLLSIYLFIFNKGDWSSLEIW